MAKENVEKLIIIAFYDSNCYHLENGDINFEKIPGPVMENVELIKSSMTEIGANYDIPLEKVVWNVLLQNARGYVLPEDIIAKRFVRFEKLPKNPDFLKLARKESEYI